MTASIQQIGDYHILEKIGVGGMADVYKAIKSSDNTASSVALKILPIEFARDEERVRRFEKEISAAKALNHRNIITLFDVGHDQGYHYYTMSLITGGDLKKRIKKGLQIAEAIRITKEIGAALQHAHSKGFIHRDLKPENILFDEDGTAVLTDFGIAKVVGAKTKMTKTGMSIGTPHYMSPQQARGVKLDHRSDLYSLGVMLYEMLTGSVPYDAEETFAVGLKHINDPIPQLPSEYCQFQPIINKLLAKEPGERFNDASSLIKAILDLESGRSIENDHGLVHRRTNLTVLLISSPVKWAAGGGLAAVIIVLAFYYVQQTMDHTSITGGGGGHEGVKGVTITEPQETVKLPQRKSVASINSKPDDADVYIGGRLVGKTPIKRYELQPGTHQLRIVKNGYLPYSNSFHIPAGELYQETIKLEQKKAFLKVSSKPTGSKVWLDGELLSQKTPVTIEDISAGKHIIKVHQDRYYYSEREVEIEEGEQMTLNVNLKGGNLVLYEGQWMLPDVADEIRQSKMGRLTINTVPDDSEIQFEDKKYIYNPGMYLQPGDYKIKIQHKGYKIKTITVSIVGKEHKELTNVVLDRIAQTGSLLVKTTPRGADVRIIGSSKHYSDNIELNSGEYTVEVSAPGFIAKEKTISLSEGEKHVLSISLKKEEITTHEALNIKSKIEKMISSANEEVGQKSWERAIEQFEKIIRIDPGNKEAKASIEVCKSKLQEIQYLRQAANKMIRDKKYVEAIEYLNDLKTLVKDNERISIEISQLNDAVLEQQHKTQKSRRVIF